MSVSKVFNMRMDTNPAAAAARDGVEAPWPMCKPRTESYSVPELPHSWAVP